MATAPLSQSQSYLLNWLTGQPPVEWHKVATSWNWDNSLAVLQWITTQPGCERATAQHIFWTGEPGNFLQFPDPAALLASGYGYVELFDLLKTIADRWVAGGFQGREIGSSQVMETRWSDMREYPKEELQYQANGLPWCIDEDMMADFDGMYPKSNDYEEGYPPAMAEYFRKMKISF